MWLILSDLHLNFNFEAIEDLNYDYVVCLGDLYNLEHQKEELQPSIDAIFYKILQRFSINKQQLLFIPGNHDPNYCFQDIEYQNATNLNLKTISIDNDLLFGLGGSISSFIIGNKEIEWKGYPHQYEDYVLQSLNDIKCSILLTHQGPSNTSTSLYDKTPLVSHTAIEGGSYEIRLWILNNKPKLVIHGHVHVGRGMQSIGNTLIVNPGAYRDGYYCIIDINTMDIQFKKCKL